MIVVRILMPVAVGSALPGHMLLFGGAISLFITHDIALQFLNVSNALHIFMEMLNATILRMTEYFCNMTESSTTARLAEFLSSIDSGSLLQSNIG